MRASFGKLFGGQRGIVFTLSVVLLALAVVGLAQTIQENTTKAAENIKYANAAHTVSAKFENVVENLTGLEKQFNKLTYTVGADRITVSDSLPNTDYQNPANQITLPVTNYKTFIEKYTDKFDTTLTEESGFGNFQLMLKPNDVLYTHGVSGGNEAIIVKPGTTSFGTYEVVVNLNGRTYKTTTDSVNFESTAGNGIDLVVKIKESTTGEIVETLNYSNLSLTQASTITLQSEGSDQVTQDTTFTMNANGELVVQSLANSTVKFDVATLYGEKESQKALAAPVDEWTVKNEVFGVLLTTKSINPNDLGTLKVTTYDAAWQNAKTDFQKGESINYLVELFNFKGEPVNVSNLRIEVLNPSNATDTLLQNQSTIDGEYRGTFSKSGQSMTAGQWTIKVTATKGRTMTASIYFNVEDFEAACSTITLSANCTQNSDNSYDVGETACVGAGLVDKDDNPLTPDSIANVTVKPLNGGNNKISLTPTYNSTLQRFEAPWAIALDYANPDMFHLYEADLTFTKQGGGQDTLHCSKQFWVKKDKDPPTLNSLTITFYGDQALTTFLPVKNQPTEGQDLPTQAKGQPTYVKVLTKDAQGNLVNVDNLSLSITLKNESTPRFAVANQQTDNGVYVGTFDTTNNPVGRYTAQAAATLGSTKTKEEKFYVEQEQCTNLVNSFTVSYFQDSARTVPGDVYVAGATVYYTVKAFDALANELTSIDNLSLVVRDPNGTLKDGQVPATPVSLPYDGSYATSTLDLPGTWSVEAAGKNGITCQETVIGAFNFTVNPPSTCPTGQVRCADGTCSNNCSVCTVGTPPNCSNCTVTQSCQNPSGTTCCAGNVCLTSCCPTGYNQCADGSCQVTCPTTCPTVGQSCTSPPGTTCCASTPSNICALSCCPSGQQLCGDGSCQVSCTPTCFQHLWEAADGSWTANVVSSKKGVENFKTRNTCADRTITVKEVSVSIDSPTNEKVTKMKFDGTQYYNGSLNDSTFGVLSGSGFPLAASTIYTHVDAITWNNKIIGTGGITQRCVTLQYKMDDGTIADSGQKCFTDNATVSTVDLKLFKTSSTLLESNIEAATFSNPYDYATGTPFNAITKDYYVDSSGFRQGLKDYIYKVSPGNPTPTVTATPARCTTVEDNIFAQVVAKDAAGEAVPYDSATLTIKDQDAQVVQTITRGASTTGQTQAVVDFGDYEYAKNYETTDNIVTYGSTPFGDTRWNYNAGGTKDTIVVASKQASNAGVNNDGQWIFDTALRNHPYATQIYTTSQTKFDSFKNGTTSAAYNPGNAEALEFSQTGTKSYTIDVSVTKGQTTVTASGQFKVNKQKDAPMTNCKRIDPPLVKPYFIIEYDDNPQYSRLDPVWSGGSQQYPGFPGKGLTTFNEGDTVYYRITVKDTSASPRPLSLSNPFVQIVGGRDGVTDSRTSPASCSSVSGENWFGEQAAPASANRTYFNDPNREYAFTTTTDTTIAQRDWHWQRLLDTGVYLDPTKSNQVVDNSGTYPTIKGSFKIPKPKIVEYASVPTGVSTPATLCADPASPLGMPNYFMHVTSQSSNWLTIKSPLFGQNVWANPPYAYDGTCQRYLNGVHNPLNSSFDGYFRIADSCAGQFYPLVSVVITPSGLQGSRYLNDNGAAAQGAGGSFYANTWDKQAECFNLQWMGQPSLRFGVAQPCVANDPACPAWARWTENQVNFALQKFAVFNKRFPKVATGSGTLNCVDDSIQITGVTPHFSGTGLAYGGIQWIRLYKKILFRGRDIVENPPQAGETLVNSFDLDCAEEDTDPDATCPNEDSDNETQSTPSQVTPTKIARIIQDNETFTFPVAHKLKDLVKKDGTSVVDTVTTRNAIRMFLYTGGTNINAKSLTFNLDYLDFRFADGSIYRTWTPYQKSDSRPHSNSCDGLVWPCYYCFKNSSGDCVNNSNIGASHARTK